MDKQNIILTTTQIMLDMTWMPLWDDTNCWTTSWWYVHTELWVRLFRIQCQ